MRRTLLHFVSLDYHFPLGFPLPTRASTWFWILVQTTADCDVVSSPLDSLPTYEGRAVLGRSRGCLDFFVVLFSLR